jgi:broad specificity phosphatase PhoE
MRQRMKAVADKYADREKVILVGHGMAFRALAYIQELPPGGIVECQYERGQPDCAYSFY